MKLYLVNIVLMLIIIVNCKGIVDGEELKNSPRGSVIAAREVRSGTLPPPHKCIRMYEAHDRKFPAPHKYRIGFTHYRPNKATAKTCQDTCDEDSQCKSVRHTVWYEWIYCMRFNITMRELKVSGPTNDIDTCPDTSYYPICTTYDKGCKGACTTAYPVSHNRTRPDWSTYHIAQEANLPGGDPRACREYCNTNDSCRSVSYQKHQDTQSLCTMYDISVQEVLDAGTGYEINNDMKLWPVFITYDRDCAGTRCTTRYPYYPHFRRRPSRKYKIGRYMRDDSATAQTCKDYCSADENCRSVMRSVTDGRRYCAKYTISVQELKDTGRNDEIFTVTANSKVNLVTYDRYCADHSGTKCTTRYPMRHFKKRPSGKFKIGRSMRDDSATAQTCKDFCSEDEICRSVLRSVRKDNGRRYCAKYTISVQELKDTGRKDEIFTVTANSKVNLVTYDRDCDSVYSQ